MRGPSFSYALSKDTTLQNCLKINQQFPKACAILVTFVWRKCYNRASRLERHKLLIISHSEITNIFGTASKTLKIVCYQCILFQRHNVDWFCTGFYSILSISWSLKVHLSLFVKVGILKVLVRKQSTWMASLVQPSCILKPNENIEFEDIFKRYNSWRYLLSFLIGVFYSNSQDMFVNKMLPCIMRCHKISSNRSWIATRRSKTTCPDHPRTRWWKTFPHRTTFPINLLLQEHWRTAILITVALILTAGGAFHMWKSWFHAAKPMAWSVCGPVAFAHLQCGIDPRTWRQKC